VCGAIARQSRSKCQVVGSFQADDRVDLYKPKRVNQPCECCGASPAIRVIGEPLPLHEQGTSLLR